MHTIRIFLSFKRHILLWTCYTSWAVGRTDTIINLTGHVWASLGAVGQHGPLANPDRAGMVLIHAGSSRARVGHLDIYKSARQ
jgi:hypothetical protein